MTMRLLTALAGSMLCMVSSSRVMAADGPDLTLYQQRCAACHLPDGAGVPGAFPPLAGRVDAIAADEAGRRYLVAVISKGLAGALEVDGAMYQGVMPAQSGLSDEQVAQLLNGLRSLGTSAPGAAAFTATEVARFRTADADLGMQAVSGLRPALAKQARRVP
ncbi:MAG: c-type cytochrome [Panacagrimonas sp.]